MGIESDGPRQHQQRQQAARTGSDGFSVRIAMTLQSEHRIEDLTGEHERNENGGRKLK